MTSMSGPRTDPIESYIKAHLEWGVAALAGRDADAEFKAWMQATAALKKSHPDEMEAIAERARAAVRQLLGGADAPTVHLRLHGYTAVLADDAASRVIERFRRRGVRPSPDPEWRERLNAMFSAALDRARPVGKTATPAAQPRAQAEQGEMQIKALVDAAVAERVANLHQGPWRDGVLYTRGQMVTAGGSTWLASADSKGVRPGTDSAGAWTLVVKRGRDGRDAK